MATDTTEQGLERLICMALAGHPCDPPPAGALLDPRAGYGGVGWSPGSHHDYDREYCVDLVQLSAFLRATQPEAAEGLALNEDGRRGASSWRGFRARSPSGAPSR